MAAATYSSRIREHHRQVNLLPAKGSFESIHHRNGGYIDSP